MTAFYLFITNCVRSNDNMNSVLSKDHRQTLQSYDTPTSSFSKPYKHLCPYQKDAVHRK